MYKTIAKLIVTGAGIGAVSYLAEQQRQRELEDARIKVELENIRRKQMVINELKAIHDKYNITTK